MLLCETRLQTQKNFINWKQKSAPNYIAINPDLSILRKTFLRLWTQYIGKQSSRTGSCFSMVIKYKCLMRTLRWLLEHWCNGYGAWDAMFLMNFGKDD